MKKVNFVAFVFVAVALSIVTGGIAFGIGGAALAMGAAAATDEFTAKSEDEIASLIEEEKFDELAKYYNEKNAHHISQIEAKVENKASKEDIDSMKEELRDVYKTQVEMLNKALEKQGLEIKKLSSQEKAERKRSFKDAVQSALKENAEKLTAMKNGDKNESVTFKVAGDMGVGTNVTGDFPVPDYVDGMGRPARRRVFMMDIMQSMSTTSDLIRWIDHQNQDGTIGGTAELAAKDQLDFDLVVGEESMHKRAAFIKVSTEMLDDISWIRSEIENELMERLMLDIDNQALNGDDTGQNFNGVVTQATAFAAGSFANAVDNANNVDVLVAAMDQIENNEHMPNYILMHPTDVNLLKVEKLSTTDKRYIDRLVTTAGQLELDGVPIIKNTGVTQGDFVVGDFTRASIVTRQDVRFEIGLDQDDFSKNRRTILAEYRGNVMIRANDTTAFVTGTFSTAAAAMETP